MEPLIQPVRGLLVRCLALAWVGTVAWGCVLGETHAFRMVANPVVAVGVTFLFLGLAYPALAMARTPRLDDPSLFAAELGGGGGEDEDGGDGEGKIRDLDKARVTALLLARSLATIGSRYEGSSEKGAAQDSRRSYGPD